MKRKAALEEQARRTAKAASLAATALLQSRAAEKERLWDLVEEEEAEAEAEELYYQVWQEAEEEEAEAEAQLYYKVWQEAEEEEAAAEETELYWQRAEDAALGLSTSAEGTCSPL